MGAHHGQRAAGELPEKHGVTATSIGAQSGPESRGLGKDRLHHGGHKVPGVSLGRDNGKDWRGVILDEVTKGGHHRLRGPHAGALQDRDALGRAVAYGVQHFALLRP